MAWLRLDDGFTKHPKFEGWSPAQRWAWLEVMEYCARYTTRGRIPTDLGLLPRSTTAGLLAKAEASGWCARDASGALWINDWSLYNASTVEERVAAYLAKNPDATANDVQRNVGGKREIVLAAINTYRFPNGSPTVPPSVPTGGSLPGTESVHARVLPVPSPKELSSSTVNEDQDAPDDDDPVPDWGSAEPQRARAWIHHAASRPDVANAVGYARRSYENGGWPSEPPPTTKPDPITVITGWINGYGWDDTYTEQMALEDWRRILHLSSGERAPGITDQQITELLEHWQTTKETRYPTKVEAA